MTLIGTMGPKELKLHIFDKIIRRTAPHLKVSLDGILQ